MASSYVKCTIKPDEPFFNWSEISNFFPVGRTTDRS